MVGVVAIASQGDWSKLAGLAFNSGDLMVLIACFLYAGYTIGLRDRPRVSGLGLLAGMALAAFLTSIPLFAWEVATGDFIWPTGRGSAAAAVRRARARLRVAGLLHARRRIDRAGPGRGVRQSGARVRRADGGRLARRTVRRVPCRGVGSGRRRDRHRAARAVARSAGNVRWSAHKEERRSWAIGSS